MISSERPWNSGGSLNQIEVYTGMMWDAEGNPIGDANPLNDAAVEELKSIRELWLFPRL